VGLQLNSLSDKREDKNPYPDWLDMNLVNWNLVEAGPISIPMRLGPHPGKFDRFLVPLMRPGPNFNARIYRVNRQASIAGILCYHVPRTLIDPSPT